jgi:hypothetical protein
MAAMPVPARSESAATEGTGSETEAVPNPSESSPPSEDPAASSSAPIDERVQREPAATDPEAAEPLGVAPEEAAPEDEFLPTEEVNQTLERRWTDAVDSVAEKVQTGERTAADADALFVELVKDLRREMTKLREYVREDGAATERVIEKYARVREMYETRIRLLDLVSPEFRKLVTGAGPEGVDELRLELRVLATHLVYQTLRIPHDVSQRIADARVAPIPAVSDGLKLLVALGLFFTWRRWAKRELPGIQSRLGMARFRDPSFGRMERVVAFVRRVRNPLEWMFLSSALFAVLSLGHAADLEAVAATVVWWFLIAWLAVSVGRAVMARRFKSTDEELEKLRTRSLRLIAAWLLVIGMGLSIAADVTGRGTLYAWVWRAFFALTIPTVVALVVWWRSRIFNALVFEAERSNFAAGLVKNRHGLGGIVAAAVGVLYLLMVRTMSRALRSMENFEGGRRALSALTQFEIIVAPLSAPESDEPEKAISEELRHRIVDTEVGDIDGVADQVLDAISAKIGLHDRSLVLVGERGAGKSRIVRRIKQRHESEITLVNCPFDGAVSFSARLGQACGIGDADVTPESFGKWIAQSGTKMVVLENIQRMTRASMGGGYGYEQMLPYLSAAYDHCSWCFTIDSSALNYVVALRGNVVAAPVHVPQWSEEKIRELIEAKCENLGLEFDVGDFRVPRHIELDVDARRGDRRRSGFYRLLWHACEGNPASAVEVFVRSLRTGMGRELFVREIREPAIEDLEQQSLTTLLILKFILQCEYSTVDEIAWGLGLAHRQVETAITAATGNMWVIQEGDRYRVSSRWFRTLTRYLMRRNLMSSPSKGGDS